MDMKRLLDANFNRAREGLRVAEDILRYGLDRQGEFEACKKLRHEIGALQQEAERRLNLMDARDSGNDVGRTGMTDSETYRAGWVDLIAANMKRAQEALRVLEEVLKMSWPAAAARCKTMRYHAYELERRAVKATMEGMLRDD